MADALCKALGSMQLSSVASRVSAVRNILSRESYCKQVKYLNKSGVLEWIYGDPNFIKPLTQDTEKEWATNIIGYKTGQWTTELGENIINDILTISGKNPRKIKLHKRAANNKKLDPDREADDGLYECKARNYKTTGTAGEKILGCPIKYCEVPRLYGKPLYIVCLGYQEMEAEKDFQLFEPKSKELKMQLAFWKDMFNISFIRATDMLDAFVESVNKNEVCEADTTIPSVEECKQSIRQPATLDVQHE